MSNSCGHSFLYARQGRCSLCSRDRRTIREPRKHEFDVEWIMDQIYEYGNDRIRRATATDINDIEYRERLIADRFVLIRKMLYGALD